MNTDEESEHLTHATDACYEDINFFLGIIQSKRSTDSS